MCLHALALVLCVCVSQLSCRYMRQVQNETLRLSTLAPYAARFSETETAVAGYSVPANTPIITALGVALKSQLAWDDVERQVARARHLGHECVCVCV